MPTDEEMRQTMENAKQHLREEIAELRCIGTQMSNVMFNLAQGTEVDARRRSNYDRLRIQWDAIQRSEPRTDRCRGTTMGGLRCGLLAEHEGEHASVPTMDETPRKGTD